MARVIAAVRSNYNPLAFICGLTVVGYGVWQMSPQWACVIIGSVVMAGVMIDAVVKIAFNLKERK